jgi:hypothetical protein
MRWIRRHRRCIHTAFAGKRAPTVLRRVQIWRSGYHCRSRLAGEHGGQATKIRMTQRAQNALDQATPSLHTHRVRGQARSYSFAARANLVCGGCKSGGLATTVGAGLLAKAVCRQQGYRLTRWDRPDTPSQSLSSRLTQRIRPKALSGCADERLHQFSFCRQGF